MSSLGMPSAKAMFSTAASLAASAMVVRTIVNDILPHRIQEQIFSSLYTFINSFSSELTIIVEEYNGFSVNELYSAAEIYLGSKISPTTRCLKVFKQEKEKSFTISMVKNEEIVESYQGMKLEWKFVCRESQRNSIHSYDGRNSISRSEIRFYHLSFHKKHKDRVLQSYLPHVLRQSKAILEEEKTLKLHTVNCDRMYGHMHGAWTSVNLNHPATLSTVAMESEQKQALMEDLERFVKRKEFYKRVGKAWKRGYLLYGPPGTGKSSLVAAIANFLNFDVYDLELTDIKRNSDLRRLLVATANRSILVIEDIDCTVELNDRAPAPPAEESRKQNQKQENPPMTLSGLLNFIDGLWSSCGDERIIIFTTNHKDKLDPALLRPGRMDMHIHMSYCGFCGFKTLAKNYLMVDDHPLFEEIQRLIAEVEVTPAQVAEELMKSDNPNVALRGLVQFLQTKKIEAEEVKNKGEKDDQRQGATDQEIKNEDQDGIMVEKKESDDLRLNGE